MSKSVCEYKRLGEIATINRGTRVTRDILSENGEFPVYQNALTPLGFFNKSNRIANTTFVISAGAAGQVGFSNVDFWAADDCFTFDNLKDVDSKFIFHFLKTKQNYINSRVRRGSIPRISRDVFNNLEIPLPPLEIQERIVKVLDNFDAICSDLKIGLPAEIEARKKQYEYYRDLLLRFEPIGTVLATHTHEVISLYQYVYGYVYLPIGFFSKLYAGATPSTTKKEYWENGTISWMSSGEVNYGEVYKTEKYITKEGYENSSTKMLPVNTVVIALAGQGKTRGTVAITRIPLCTNQSLCGIVTNDLVYSEYLRYFLQSQYNKLRAISSGDGTRGGLNLKMINEFVIPVPPLEKQQEIVSILDRFDSLCNDLTSGLPAEIEARQKQYEYYRDKLLSFKKKEV